VESDFFFVLFLFFHKARKAAKSGLVLFHEGMELFSGRGMKDSFARFERPAAKGHEESIWIVSLWKDMKMEKSVVKEAFAKTEEPLGWYFAGMLSDRREAFDFYKKSAEEDCSWGQVKLGWYFRRGDFVEKDEKVCLEWLEKAESQNNPSAMHWLGYLFGCDGDMNKVVPYYLAAAQLGWKESMGSLAAMLRNGVGCEKDLSHAAMWSAKGGGGVFWNLLKDARRALENRETEDLDCDFDQRCYALGWGLYWHLYGSGTWNILSQLKVFGNDCLDFYCSCVELQRESIFTFLLCWNRTTGGIKGPGCMIGKMVWKGREETLVKKFEHSGGEELETKRQ
jgi:hypothetical protein